MTGGNGRAGADRRRGEGPSGGRGPTDRAEVPPEEQVFFCDLCGAQMLNLHCKLICEQCGYKRDCSDP